MIINLLFQKDFKMKNIMKHILLLAFINILPSCNANDHYTPTNIYDGFVGRNTTLGDTVSGYTISEEDLDKGEATYRGSGEFGGGLGGLGYPDFRWNTAFYSRGTVDHIPEPEVAFLVAPDEEDEEKLSVLKDFMKVVSSNSSEEVERALGDLPDKSILNIPFRGIYVIHLAVYLHNPAVVKLLLEVGTDPYSRGRLGNTALHEATMAGLDMVAVVLGKNSSGIDVQNAFGATALQAAAQHSLETVALLVESGADLDLQDGFGNTALHLAVMRAQPEIITFLLEHGADWSLEDRRGMTPWHKAAGDCGECIMAFLEYDKSMIDEQTRLGQTALHIAVLSGQLEVVEDLLRHGADPNKADLQAYTPLHMAAFVGHEPACRALLSSNRTDADLKNVDGNTPLMLSAQEGHEELSRLFIRSNADVTIANNFYMTPLHIFAVKNDVLSARLILDREKVNLNIRDIDGSTPLLASINYFGHNMSRFLLDSGADPNEADFVGNTPIHVASVQGDMESVELLLSRTDVVVNTRNMRGMTPVYFALNHSGIVQLLLNHQADPFLSGPSSWTSLHEAAKLGNVNSTKLIVEKYRDEIDKRDREGWTALHIAAYFGHRQVVEYLLDQGADPFLYTFGDSNIFNLQIYKDPDMFNAIKKKMKDNTNKMKSIIRVPDIFGRCSISTAAQSGNFQAFLALWELGDLVKADIEDCRVLHFASEGNSPAIIEYVLNKTRLSIETSMDGGLTPVMVAAHYCSTDSFRYLLQLGANISRTTVNDVGVLHWSASGGDPDILEEVLARTKADVNAADSEGYTPLMYAVANGREQAVTILLKKHADVFVENIYGEDAINLATKGGSDILAQMPTEHYDYDTLLAIALRSNEQNTDQIQYLLSMSTIAEDPVFYAAATGDHIGLTNVISELGGTDFKIRKKFPRFMKEFLRDYDNFISDPANKEDNTLIPTYLEYLTPLDMTVIFFGDSRTLRLLVDHLNVSIASLNERKTMWTLTDFSMFTAQSSYKDKMISRSLINILLEADGGGTKNAIGWGLAHKAAWIGYRDVFLQLDGLGVASGEADVFGRTPLHIAAARGHPYLADQLLLRGRGAVGARDRLGFTPLHLTAVYSRRKLFTRLSEASTGMPSALRGKFVERKEEDRPSAKERWFVKTAMTLVDAGADMDAQDSAFGWTPLHWAAFNGDRIKVGLLLAWGAKVNIPSWSGQTPMYLARHWNRREIYRKLKRHGGVW